MDVKYTHTRGKEVHSYPWNVIHQVYPHTYTSYAALHIAEQIRSNITCRKDIAGVMAEWIRHQTQTHKVMGLNSSHGKEV